MKYDIIFFGTSGFACPSLEAIHKAHNLLAVVASPEPSPVKLLANKLKLKLFDPANPNAPDFLAIIKSFTPDFICLAAYGYILKPEILKLPKIGAINLHPSMLPIYRGPAPIQWAILNGDEVTGVTTMSMNEKIDQGGILLQRTVGIQPEETYGEIEDKLSKIGADLLIETIDKFNSLQPIAQKGIISYAPKITKEMRKINWNKPANEVVNLIRAFSPKPLAYTIFRNKRLEILKASPAQARLETELKSVMPGEIAVISKTIVVGTTTQPVELKVVKPEGKREQTALDFINGYRLQNEEKFDY